MTDRVRLTDDETCARARKLAGPWDPTIYYFLDQEQGMRNGGRDPTADDCATHWKDEHGKRWATSDCVGYATWSKGIRRKLPGFAVYGGHINTDSMILDAEGPQSVFRKLGRPRRGALIVIPSVFDAEGRRVSPGHVGVVVDVLIAEWDDRLAAQNALLSFVRVAHCSPRNQKRLGQAIAITDAALFGGRRWRWLDLVL